MKKLLLICFLFIQQVLFSQALDFSVSDNTGAEFNLLETLQSDQFVLIDFLATWCGPCAEGVPIFSEIYHDFGCNERDLFVLSISSDASDYESQVFHNLYNGSHPIVSGVDGGGAHVHQDYQISSLPYYVLIDTSGFVMYEGTELVSYQDLSSLLLENGIEQNDCQVPVHSQTQEFHQGWNLLSKSILTENESMESVFLDVLSNLILLKDAEGNVFWPSFSVNAIGDYNNSKGYLAYFSEDVSLTWVGELLSSDFSIYLNSGWNIVPYYGVQSINSGLYFNSITSSIIIVKDESGDIYYPAYNFNNIGDVHQGKAYYIKVSEGVNFQY